MNPDDILLDVEKLKSEETLKTYDGPGRIVTSWDKLDELHAAKKFVPSVSVRTKIPTLDEHIRDCRGGQLVILSGDEGEGKTLLARTFTNNFSEQDTKCLWFSYEERPDEFLAKFQQDNKPLPLFLLPSELEMSKISWLHERMKEARIKYKGLDVVFIDHLHYLTDEIESGNMSNDLGRICRKLKLIAVNENIVIVLIVHTNRSEASDEPSIRSLRDSGMIGKEADTVIFIWRLDGGDDAVLKIAKCRATGTKNKKVNVTKLGPYLVEREQDNYGRPMHAEKLKARRQGND